MKKQAPHQTRLTLPGDNPPPGSKQWIIQQLTNKTRTHKTATQLTICPTCKALTLYGYTHPPTGRPTTVDPIRLDQPTQTIFHTAGRPLYQLTTNTTGTAYNLHYSTGPSPALTILTNHKCGYPPPGQLIFKPPQTTDQDQPPF